MIVDELIEYKKQGRELIFDLDNTIYKERDFLFLAYQKIANILFKKKESEVFDFLTTEFLEKGRNCLFDKLVDEFSIDEIITVDCCIEVLRNTYCEKCLFAYPWFYKFLNKAGKDFKLKIITNGNIQQQKNKIQSLDLGVKDNSIEVVFSNSTKPKPSSASYFSLYEVEKFYKPIYVGDSEIDREFCNNIGINFYDVSKLL